jgi:cytochrome P450
MDRGSFPIGSSVSPEALHTDPYPIYARLRAEEPISWIKSLNMWYVTRYEHVHAILMDDQTFTTAWQSSLIFDTFGAQMLTSEGSEHERYRKPTRSSFSPGHVRSRMEADIHACAQRLVDDLKAAGSADLRPSFAARLPIQVILTVFGIPSEAEAQMRRWYNSFERALSNFEECAQVRAEAHRNVAECQEYLGHFMRETAAVGGDQSLLGKLVNAAPNERLSDDEIRRNMLIILFGGISTVEALILNALWALFTHPQARERVSADSGLIGRVIEETLRWLSPVQSATRHVTRDVIYEGVRLAQGDVVNCMLGSANRDPSQFLNPDVFDIDRLNAQRHVAFATGVHSCLGFNLAKAEARIALRLLLSELRDLRLADGFGSAAPEGYEFRQPRSMRVAWD